MWFHSLGCLRFRVGTLAIHICGSRPLPQFERGYTRDFWLLAVDFRRKVQAGCFFFVTQKHSLRRKTFNMCVSRLQRGSR